MSLSVKTLKCDGGCRSCYEERIRANNNIDYDIGKIFKTINDKKDSQLTLHGGEPLLLNIKDIEKLLKHSFEKSGRSGIQTGGHSITDKHIELFKKYNTHVGISLDGNTAQLNQGRWNKKGFESICELRTKQTVKNMYKLKSANIRMSIISILRKYNADFKNIDSFLEFLRWLYFEFNIVDIKTNVGIVYEEEFKEDEELTSAELGNAFIKIYELCTISNELKIQPIRDVIELIMGHNSSTCNFSKCDPFHTTAEITINENGELGNCLKSSSAPDGIQTLKSDKKTEERYNVLIQIPEIYGGCKDCRFWFICFGGCPGSGIDNDWRNKTRFCEAWKTLFTFTYDRLKGIFPNIYLQPDYFPKRINKDQVLKSLNSTWRNDQKLNITEEKEKELKKVENCTNINHGDSPHGDAHGDHTDRSNK